MKVFLYIAVITITLVACRLKTKQELLVNKWQLVNVFVDDEICNKPAVIKWLKEINDTIKKSTVVTDYAESGKLYCYFDNMLLNGLSKDKTENDIYRIINDNGLIDEQGNFIMYCYKNRKTKIIKEEIIQLTNEELITRSYDPDFIKIAGGNHLIFVYKCLD
jgi:hypothetical protein